MAGNAVEELAIQFTAQGVQAVQAALNSLNGQLDGLLKGMQAVQAKETAFRDVSDAAVGGSKAMAMLSGATRVLTGTLGFLANAVGTVANKILGELNVKKFLAVSAGVSAVVTSFTGMSAASKVLAGTLGVTAGATVALAGFLKNQLAKATEGAAAGFNTLQGKFTGFVKQGFNASVYSDILNMHLDRTARILAGLFQPEISKGIDLLSKFNDWLQRGIETHGDLIASLVKGVAVWKLLGTVMSTYLPFFGGWVGMLVRLWAAVTVSQEGVGGLAEKIKPLAEGLASAASAITEALAPAFRVLVALMESLSPVLAEIVTSVGGAFAEVLKGIQWLIEQVEQAYNSAVMLLRQAGVELKTTDDIREKQKDKEKENRGPLAGKAGGATSLTGIWDQIAATSIKIGSGIPEQQLEVMKLSLEEQRLMNAILRGQRRPLLNGPSYNVW